MKLTKQELEQKAETYQQVVDLIERIFDRLKLPDTLKRMALNLSKKLFVGAVTRFIEDSLQ